MPRREPKDFELESEDSKGALERRLNQVVADIVSLEGALRRAKADEKRIRSELGRGGLAGGV